MANIFIVFLNLSRYVSEQYTLAYVVWSSSSWTNLFFHNKSYLLTNVGASKVVSLRIYWARPVIVPVFKALYEVCCMHVGKSVLNFCFSHDDIIKSPSLLHHLQLWETKEVIWWAGRVWSNCHFAFSQKSWQWQSRAMRCVTMVEKPVPWSPLFRSSTYFPADVIKCVCNNVGLRFVLLKQTRFASWWQGAWWSLLWGGCRLVYRSYFKPMSHHLWLNSGTL